jgi:hypothetical protein
MEKYNLKDITWVGIETSNICNMTCDYCPKSKPDLDHREIGIDLLSKSNYLKIVNGLSHLSNLSYVTLTNFNEFFQTPELTSFFLPELKKRDIPYLVASNGSIVPKNIEYYKDHNPKFLVLGLQTVTEEQYFKNNRIKNLSWDKYIKRVADLIKFFSEECPETIISIEVAVNPTQTLPYKILRAVENKDIPSRVNQEENLKAFIDEISTQTQIKFLNDNNHSISRYDSQEVMAYSPDSRVFFALKEFRDITNFYDNLPTSYDPICNMDSITFDTQGNVKLCCIDHKNSTQFSTVKDDEMAVIFDKYVGLINQMRTVGSPFSGCRNCMGYKNKSEKLAKTVWRKLPRAKIKFST